MAALRVEVEKLARQRLLLAALAALTVLVALFAWGMWRFPSPRHLPGTTGGEFLLGGKMKTAELLSFLLLRVPIALDLLIPLMLATVTGGLLAGERNLGTLRTLLTRPVSRLSLYGAKLAAAWLVALVLTAFLAVLSLGVGYALFGGGDLLPLETGTLTILAEKTALLRLAQGYFLAALAMTAVASLGMMFSAFCDNPLTAAGLTVAFLLISGALGLLALGPMSYFESWRPHLLTTHLALGGKIFSSHPDWAQVWRSLAYLGGYSAVTALVGGLVFWRRDVTG